VITTLILAVRFMPHDLLKGMWSFVAEMKLHGCSTV